MSDLTDALDKILNWLQTIENTSSLIKTGLSNFKIDAIIGDSNLQLDTIQGDLLLKEISDILFFSGDKRLINPLIKVLRLPPTKDSEKDETLDYLRSMSCLYLMRGGDNSVMQIIEALQNEYWFIRY